MAEILVNENDLESIIKSYSEKNKGFAYKNGAKDKLKWTFNFYLDGKECKIDAHFKKDCCKILPVGKNEIESNLLIAFLESVCPNANVKHVQYIFECNKTISEKMISDLDYENLVIITKKTNGISYEIKGHGGDIVYLNVYENKLMIQGKPLCVFGIIINYLSDYILIESSINQNYNSQVTHDIHRKLLFDKIKKILGDAYNYLDQPSVESLSSSFDIIEIYKHQTNVFEDYSGFLTGAFKALESYLKKILINNYGYRFNRGATFDMFKKNSANGNLCAIEMNNSISKIEQQHLLNLYNIFQNKRNVYLHGSGIGNSTRVIKKYSEARDILNEIMNAICESYKCFK